MNGFFSWVNCFTPGQKILARCTLQQSPTDWLTKARIFYAAENWIGALSSARNALRLDVKNLAAWHLGSDILIKEDRQYAARRFARALKRFALKAGDHSEVIFAEKRIAEVDVYYANYHRLIGETDLTHFSAKGDLARVRELLENGGDPSQPNRSDWTPLHCVAMRGMAEMARLLVEHGANLEAEDVLKETPIITACRFGNKALVPALLQLGADVRHVAKEKHTALWYAIYSMKDLKTVKLLIQAGADPNETYEYGDNPFLLAVSAQKAEVTHYLLSLTDDPARMNQHQVCALHFAAGYDDVPLIEALLARGVDINRKTNWGSTAVISATESNSVNALRYLLAHGADKTAKTQYGETAESIAERREIREAYEILTGKQLDPRRD